MEDDLAKALGTVLKDAKQKDLDTNKYISALFRAEEAFRKELSEYDKHRDKKQEKYDMSSLLRSITSDALKQLPMKYRLALKLPWPYIVDALSGFLKELGTGPTEDVLTNLAEKYTKDLMKE